VTTAETSSKAGLTASAKLLLQASGDGYGNGKRSSQLGKKKQQSTAYASKQ